MIHEILSLFMNEIAHMYGKTGMNAGSARGIAHPHTCYFLRQNPAGPGDHQDFMEVIAIP